MEEKVREASKAKAEGRERAGGESWLRGESTWWVLSAVLLSGMFGIVMLLALVRSDDVVLDVLTGVPALLSLRVMCGGVNELIRRYGEDK